MVRLSPAVRLTSRRAVMALLSSSDTSVPARPVTEPPIAVTVEPSITDSEPVVASNSSMLELAETREEFFTRTSVLAMPLTFPPSARTLDDPMTVRAPLAAASDT